MKVIPPLKVSVDARLRDYRYTAWLTPTGTLRQVTAGCRAWTNFEEAQEHYRGHGPYDASKWQDEFFTHEVKRDMWRAAKHYAHRMDARRTLVLLQEKVKEVQGRIERKRAKALIKARKQTRDHKFVVMAARKHK